MRCAAETDLSELATAKEPNKTQSTIQSFERQSRKFWVPPEHKRYVQAVIRQQLPIRRRGIIHSVYLDTEDKAMYVDRLVSREGAKLVRLRWYGEDNPKQVYVEIKTHRSNGVSTKDRFPLTLKQAKRLLSGQSPWLEPSKCQANTSKLPNDLPSDLPEENPLLHCEAESNPSNVPPSAPCKPLSTSGASSSQKMAEEVIALVQHKGLQSR